MGRYLYMAYMNTRGEARQFVEYENAVGMAIALQTHRSEKEIRALLDRSLELHRLSFRIRDQVYNELMAAGKRDSIDDEKRCKAAVTQRGNELGFLDAFNESDSP